MKTILIAQAKEVRDDGSIVEIMVWELAEPISSCTQADSAIDAHLLRSPKLSRPVAASSICISTGVVL
ncbi:MAG: hypothetical protein WC073_16355 [Sterolibacterium sp.]